MVACYVTVCGGQAWELHVYGVVAVTCAVNDHLEAHLWHLAEALLAQGTRGAIVR